MIIPVNQIDRNSRAQEDLSDLVQKMRANLPSSYQNLAVRASGSPTMSSHSVSSQRERLDKLKTQIIVGEGQVKQAKQKLEARDSLKPD